MSAPQWPHGLSSDAWTEALERFYDEHEDEIREQIATGERDQRGRLNPMEGDQ